MSLYYDKNGDTISVTEWAKLFEDDAYRQIEHIYLKNGCSVSTVWLGRSHGSSPSGQMIFETMVVHPDSDDKEIYRYATVEQALAHHKVLAGNEATMLGVETPNRWQQVVWELKDDEDKG